MCGYIMILINCILFPVSADPDLVANDGIYSRYLTDYPRPGRCVLLCNQHSP